jgi:Rrf2 family protein
VKISNKCHYACKAVLDIAIYGNKDNAVTVADITARQGVPLKYLEQIVILLKKARILASRRGQQGGYFLGHPPEQISIAHILSTIDGPLGSPSLADKKLRTSLDSPIEEVWSELSKLEQTMLERISIADLMKRTEELQEENMYYI